MRPTERAAVLVLRGHAGDVEFGAIPQLYNAVRLPHRATTTGSRGCPDDASTQAYHYLTCGSIQGAAQEEVAGRGGT